MNEDILQNLNYRLDQALDYGRGLMEDDDAATALKRYKTEAEKYIHSNPLKSMAAGLVAGYLLGKLFSSDD